MTGPRQAGDRALLVETDDPPARLAAAIANARLHGIADIVPGARTVLVITEPGSWHLADLAAAVSSLPPWPETGARPAGPIEIPVVYDGQDLAEVARLTSLPVTEVIARHTEPEYTVGWLGFMPGFGYLTGLDERLSQVPRLASPRLVVPAGAVAIAGGLTAVYPRASPGGWRLIGRTSAPLWDPEREPPALLTPGCRVRFAAIAALTSGDERQQPGRPARRSARPGLAVLRPGPLATVQDLGRPGYAAIGVPTSGAADPDSLIAANRLAGNPDSTAAIELTLGRAAFRARGSGLRLATSGAPAPVWATGRAEIAAGTAFDLPDGGEVRIGAPAAGLRTYLAVAGGFLGPQVLGSRSADLFSGLGGDQLQAGDQVPVGAPSPSPGGTRVPASPRMPVRAQVTALRVQPGPRLDVFGADALRILCGSVYTVTAASNRTGLRLDGQPLPKHHATELPSEGMVTGSLQVPHDGRPIVLLADHPTVGGYPVIAVVASPDIGLAGQLRPGDRVSFYPASAR
jgi:KipI family sensor histidine kinase inhibitor